MTDDLKSASQKTKKKTDSGVDSDIYLLAKLLVERELTPVWPSILVCALEVACDSFLRVRLHGLARVTVSAGTPAQPERYILPLN